MKHRAGKAHRHVGPETKRLSKIGDGGVMILLADQCMAAVEISGRKIGTLLLGIDEARARGDSDIGRRLFAFALTPIIGRRMRRDDSERDCAASGKRCFIPLSSAGIHRFRPG